MFVLLAYLSLYVKTTLPFAQINNKDNKNSNNVTKARQAHYFPFKDIMMEHKVVAYHLNPKIDSPHPAMYILFCKADDKLKSNSLFVI